MSDILRDVYQLVVTFYPALVEDPRHIYISALPQCPGTSPLRSRIPALAVPRSLLPYPAWPLWITRTIDQPPTKTPGDDDFRWLIRSSPDGQWVAACLRSGRNRRGDIDLRDAATGIVLRTLHVHTSGLVDFGISSDSRFIVSATRDREICITDTSSGVVVASYSHTDGHVTRVAFRSKDSELIVVHTDRRHGLGRAVRFLILDWDRTKRTEGELRPRWESRGSFRKYPRYWNEPWSISPNGRWGVLWATGDLLDLDSFDEARLPFVPDQNAPGRNILEAGTWLSDTSLVCSIPDMDAFSLIVVDIGKNVKEIEMRLVRSLPTRHKVYAMKASASGTLVALHADSWRGQYLSLWDPTGDEIRLVKHTYNCDFCLSPHGDTLYHAKDSNWSVIPTSQMSTATAQPLHSTALKFSATRDTIMATTQRPADHSGWEVGNLSWRFSTSSGTACVVSRHNFGPGSLVGHAALTPDTHSMILPDTDVVLHSMVESSKRFPDRSRHGEHKGYPTRWYCASMSPNLLRIVACGLSPDASARISGELTFAVWDTASASLLHAFRTPRPSLPARHKEIVINDALDIYYLLDHHSFVYRYSDWSTSYLDKPRLLPQPEPGPVPGEWFQIGDDGWVTRSDGHPEVGKPGRGREKLFWIPPPQRFRQLWRSDQHLLAMVTEYDVIVLDLSDFDDDTKEQHVPRLQIKNE